jgi:hypothetical protein
MSQVTPFIAGRNNRISGAQRASLESFLSSGPGLTWLAQVSPSERLVIAKSGYSALPHGKTLDDAFVAAWGRWAATQEIAPAKSHMWIKGACIIALGC